MSAEQAAEAARESARRSLERMAGRDPHLVLGFLSAWVCQNVSLAQLADLIEQLDRSLPPQEWLDTGSGPGWPPGSGVVELPDDPDGD